MTSIVFPGQGSQFMGMAMDFNDNFSIGRETFQEIEDSVKINIRDIISKNINDSLNQTKYTQISIFSASIVIYKCLIEKIGLSKIKPNFFLGHSLGEYTALVASNKINLLDASKLIKIRSDLMSSAISPNVSGMAAIIGKNSEFIQNIINKNNLNLEIANDNSPLQVVVSGLVKDIENYNDLFLNEGVKRYVKLNVSAAFHSKYMLQAQNELKIIVDKTLFYENDSEIISNYDAKIKKNVLGIKESLKNQMANKVRWTESIKNLEKTDTKTIIEIGPGKVLSGLITRISKKFDIVSINKITDMEKLI